MKHTVRVRALSNVLGLRHGDVVDVVATPRVETLIRGGHLVWVDEAGAKVEYIEAVPEPESVSSVIGDSIADPPKLRTVKPSRRTAADDAE